MEAPNELPTNALARTPSASTRAATSITSSCHMFRAPSLACALAVSTTIERQHPERASANGARAVIQLWWSPHEPCTSTIGMLDAPVDLVVELRSVDRNIGIARPFPFVFRPQSHHDRSFLNRARPSQSRQVTSRPIGRKARAVRTSVYWAGPPGCHRIARAHYAEENPRRADPECRERERRFAVHGHRSSPNGVTIERSGFFAPYPPRVACRPGSPLSFATSASRHRARNAR